MLLRLFFEDSKTGVALPGTLWFDIISLTFVNDEDDLTFAQRSQHIPPPEQGDDLLIMLLGPTNPLLGV